MIQIAPPSRDTIKEYQIISDELDTTVGRLTGRFAEPDWLPITYVKRAYAQASLAGLYRLARVGLVTPLRDGMNLVAHEYVGAQDPENPGVLVLSRFAGAAEIFHDALIVNPFDTDETAEAMRRALAMPLDERKERWRNLFEVARTHNVENWAHSYLRALTGETTETGGGDTEKPDTDSKNPILPRTTTALGHSTGTALQRLAPRFLLPPWLRAVFSAI
jgi:trehalose 6-phosphate synthase